MTNKGPTMTTPKYNIAMEVAWDSDATGQKDRRGTITNVNTYTTAHETVIQYCVQWETGGSTWYDEPELTALIESSAPILRSPDLLAVARLIGSDASSREELLEDVQRLVTTQSTFLKEATKRWQQRVLTAHQFGWADGKLHAMSVVREQSPELATVIDFLPYTDRMAKARSVLSEMFWPEDFDAENAK